MASLRAPAPRIIESMIYGPRFFQSFGNKTSPRKKIQILNREFQYRYTGYLLLLIATAIVLFGVPIYYFVNQNYQMFFNLAYQTSPELLPHLEREIILLNNYLIAGGVALLCFCGLMGLRMTSRLVGPVALMENHLRKITKGYWDAPPMRLRDNDEFKELIKSYNYFYRSLRTLTEAEIKQLEKVKVETADLESARILKNLLASKREQIGIDGGADVIDLFSSESESHGPRREPLSIHAYRKPSSL